jgi:hypothetical protein
MASKIEFIAQPEGVRVDRLGEVQIKLVTSQKYSSQALLIGALCDGQTLVKVTLEPYVTAPIGSKKKPLENVDMVEKQQKY